MLFVDCSFDCAAKCVRLRSGCSYVDKKMPLDGLRGATNRTARRSISINLFVSSKNGAII